MINGIVNKPNTILHKQKIYQNSHAPLYFRGPRARLYFTLYMVGWTAAVLGTATGIYSLAKGKSSA